MTAAFQHAAEEIADEGAACVTDGQGARGVGRDELHVHVSRGLRLDPPEFLSGHQGLVQDGLEPGGREPHV
jgi:hypothetical protein